MTFFIKKNIIYNIILSILIVLSYIPLIETLYYLNLNIVKFLMIQYYCTNTLIIDSNFTNILSICFIPSIIEELVFRKIIQNIILNFNYHKNIIITSILFSMSHMNISFLIPLFTISVIYGYIYHWTNKIYIVIIMHFCHNIIAVLFYKLLNECLLINYINNYQYLYYVIISTILLLFLGKIIYIYNN